MSVAFRLFYRIQPSSLALSLAALQARTRNSPCVELELTGIAKQFSELSVPTDNHQITKSPNP